MDTISQLKAVQQLQDLHSVQNQIQEISTQTHSLSVNEQARNQDFLALYNLTTVYGMKLHDLEIQTVDKLKKHANDQNKTIIGFEDKILKHIHTTDMKIESFANTLRERSSNISDTGNTSLYFLFYSVKSYQSFIKNTFDPCYTMYNC